MSLYDNTLTALRTFAADTRGSVAFEAIWVGLFLAFMVAPTIFVYQLSVTRLDGSWLQRLATRQDAVLGACNGQLLLRLPFVEEDGVNATNRVLCTSIDSSEPHDELIWPRIENAVSDDFPTLVDDMKNEGDFQVHRSRLLTTEDREFELGDGSDPSLFERAVGIIGLLNNIPETMAPATEYYRWDQEHWRRGHDRIIWNSFSSDSQKMFPNVFPSR